MQKSMSLKCGVHYRKVTNGSVDGPSSSNMAGDGAGGSGFGFLISQLV